MLKKMIYALLLTTAVVSLQANADVVAARKLAHKYEVFAKHINPAYKGLSAEDGHAFYSREILVRSHNISCASCHTGNPGNKGRHIVTDKPIRPLAPARNAKRFASVDKVEKNFDKHCLDIIGRQCSAEEKGNFIAYLLTIK
ncbi:Cytochrome c'' [Methylophilaceae bacterium]|nr:Cytochrome c'' [Methylophilaceae bacterium]